MNIALVGTGKTGLAVDRVAGELGHRIVARFNSQNPLLDAAGVHALSGADVIIDFTTPELALRHIERYCAWNMHAIIGTTGWHSSLDAVRRLVASSRAGILYAPNFSIGVAVLSRVLRTAGALMNRLETYDPYVHEWHHRHKKDSPSGTGLHFAQLLLEQLDRKTHIDTETQHNQIDPGALHVSSTRTGHMFGTHTIGFDSPYDQLRLTHESKSRDGFAYGAIQAALWLQGRQGLFTLDDLLHEWLQV